MPLAGGGAGNARWPNTGKDWFMRLLTSGQLPLNPSDDELEQFYNDARNNRGLFRDSPLFSKKLKSLGGQASDDDVAALFVSKSKFITKWTEYAKEIGKDSPETAQTELGQDNNTREPT